MKRNPEKILNSLTQHSSDLEYKFERLYRILFNDEMYYIAYQHIYAKQGNMTKGVDGKTVDGFSVSHIEQLIDTLKNETYQPKPSQRVYIPKKNGEEEAAGQGNRIKMSLPLRYGKDRLFLYCAGSSSEGTLQAQVERHINHRYSHLSLWRRRLCIYV